MSAHTGMYTITSKPQNANRLYKTGIEMTRTKGWAIQMKRGGFVNFPHSDLPYFEAYRIITFKTQKQAKAWLANDKFWHDKAIVVPIVITTKEKGAE
jgi:hypothetical protein